MNLAQIVVLLQTVLALLINPATANNPQVQTLASQAIGIASIALSQPSTTPLGEVPTSTITIETPSSTDPGSPIVVNVNTVQSPAPQDNQVNQNLGVQAPVEQPTCSLTATVVVPGTVILAWTDSDNTNGSFSTPVGASGGSFIWSSPDPILFSKSSSTKVGGPSMAYKAQFGDGAVCYTYFTQQQMGHTGDLNYPMPGDVSTSVVPSGYPSVQ